MTITRTCEFSDYNNNNINVVCSRVIAELSLLNVINRLLVYYVVYT